MTTHWFAARQASPICDAQVFVTALQVPVAHTASEFASSQMPVWSVSIGSASPGDRSTTHVKEFRAQCWEIKQSPSTQQPPAPSGMHVRPTEQTPDWQSAAVEASHPGCPFA